MSEQIITNEKGEQFRVPLPPEEIFQNEFHLTNDTAPVYKLTSLESIKDIGTIAHYEGIPYVRKGWTHPVSLAAINIVKRIIKESLRFPFLFIFYKKEKLIQSFNTIFEKVYSSYVIKPEYLCRPAFYFGNFIYATCLQLKIEDKLAYEFAFNLAQIVEADDVYRYRMQDLIGVINPELSSRKNIKLMLKTLKEREIHGAIYEKIKKIIPFVFLLPKLPLDLLEEAKMDESDWYWTYFNSHSYKYGGLNKNIRKIEKYPEVAAVVKC